MNRLVLIDGNAILHRAYHALPPLTAPDGSVVNAVYGFTTMLYRLTLDLKPTHYAVAFDRPAPTFRKELYDGYQAKRPKLDDELASQIPKVHDLVAAFGIKIFEKDGFEADDIIGTLCRQITSSKPQIPNTSEIPNTNGKNIQVIIVTGDRDLLQLVEDQKVYVYMPVKGLSESKLYDSAAVKEKMGVVPAQVADLKALAGDSSDNYPGVAGIGPKTAVELLAKYGSLENILHTLNDNPSVFSQQLRHKLTAGVETAKLFRDVATIRHDVPLEVEINSIEVKSLDTPEARAALEEFQFPSLVKRLDNLYKTEEPKASKRIKKKSQAEKNEEQLSLI